VIRVGHTTQAPDPERDTAQLDQARSIQLVRERKREVGRGRDAGGTGATPLERAFDGRFDENPEPPPVPWSRGLQVDGEQAFPLGFSQ
jgi:hypothetical protein